MYYQNSELRGAAATVYCTSISNGKRGNSKIAKTLWRIRESWWQFFSWKMKILFILVIFIMIYNDAMICLIVGCGPRVPAAVTSLWGPQEHRAAGLVKNAPMQKMIQLSILYFGWCLCCLCFAISSNAPHILLLLFPNDNYVRWYIIVLWNCVILCFRCMHIKSLSYSFQRLIEFVG